MSFFMSKSDPRYIIHPREFCESMVKDAINVLYKHSVFQSEAQTCLIFSQIQPQNMPIMCLSKNIENIKFHDLTHVLGVWVGRGCQNEENIDICTF